MKILEFAKKEKMVTLNYPVEPYEVTDGYRGKPEYDFAKCIGCGACAVACPPNAISLKENGEKDSVIWRMDYGRCIFCGRCEEVCPTSAISLTKEYMMSVLFDKQDLTVTGEIKLKKCSSCGSPYSTERLCNYVIDKLVSTGWDETSIDEKVKHVHLCPQCRREQAVESYVSAEGGHDE